MMTNKELGFDRYRDEIEFRMKFRTDKICLKHLKKIRFPDGLICPSCRGVNFYKVRDDYYDCKNCREKFSTRTGTIFERIHLPLKLWFAVVFLVNREPDIKERQLSKRLGIDRSTAQTIFRKIKKREKKTHKDEPVQTLEERWREYQMWKKPLEKDPTRIT